MTSRDWRVLPCPRAAPPSEMNDEIHVIFPALFRSQAAVSWIWAYIYRLYGGLEIWHRCGCFLRLEMKSGRVRGVHVSHVAWRSVDSCLFVMVVPQSGWFTSPAEKSPGFSSAKNIPAIFRHWCIVLNTNHYWVCSGFTAFHSISGPFNPSTPQWDYSTADWGFIMSFVYFARMLIQDFQEQVSQSVKALLYQSIVLMLLTPVVRRVHHVL